MSKTINMTKLEKELLAGDTDANGWDDDGTHLTLLSGTTDEQKARAAEIVENHNPTFEAAELRTEAFRVVSLDR